MDQKTLHVWLPNHRSLCDLKYRVKIRPGDDLDALERLDREAPACGACLVIVATLRGDAYFNLLGAPSVYPPSPVEAIELLRDTHWDEVLDVEGWRKRDYRTLGEMFDPDQSRRALERHQKQVEARWDQLRAEFAAE